MARIMLARKIASVLIQMLVLVATAAAVNQVFRAIHISLQAAKVGRLTQFFRAIHISYMEKIKANLLHQ
uniref:ATP binding protein n=1 Tax=Solanum tuberosum TaxID=4113 RepID=M1BNK2_SOLTU